MGYGIRVVLVMNRKGGSGKSTLCRALASAAAARDEAVTIFDTDASKSCLKWMQAGKEAGSWSPLVEVIHTLDAHRVAEAIGQIYEQPDQEHLILIDTFGGGSEAQDVLAVAAHRIICPMMLSRGDLSGPEPVLVPDSATVQQAWDLLAAQGVGQVPVVNAQRQLVGLLTRADLNQAQAIAFFNSLRGWLNAKLG